jgi:hypothetical protein
MSWRSCKQTILTKTIIESELASDTTIVESEWLRELLIVWVEKSVATILLNCDN